MIVPLTISTTHFGVPCSKTTGVLNDTGVSIVPFLYKYLEEVEYNQQAMKPRVIARYNTYDDSVHQVLLPINTLSVFKDYIVRSTASPTSQSSYVTTEEFYLDPWEPSIVSSYMKPDIVLRDGQEDMIDFLVNESNTFKPLSAQTGTGKTLSSIYAASKIGHPTMIVLPMLIKQWHREILKFTDLDKKDIYIIKGYPALHNLWKLHETKDYRPTIILMSTRTLMNYCHRPQGSYTDIPSYAEMCKTFGIGTKIIDETHLNFWANVIIDLHSNIRHNIYLSATYQRASPSGRRCFDLIYPKQMRYGEANVDRYTQVYVVSYSLPIPQSDHSFFKTQNGYQHTQYEKYLLRCGSYFYEYYRHAIRPCIITYYVNQAKPDQRCLIIVSMRETAIQLYTLIADDMRDGRLPLRTLAVYFSGESDAYGRTENLEADIIISTLKSCGTGRDIADLKTCINTVSFSSSPQAQQLVGRLRKLPDEETIFVDIWNRTIQSHYIHQRNRRNAYYPRVKQINNITY